jgi:DeoR/GlpR family transcriptional regulator of sugar metabolism
MLAEERRAILQRKLRDEGYVQVTELANEMGISGATIRRDIILLEKEGVCIRKRGGAVRASQGVTTEIPYATRRLRYLDEKSEIAKAALEFIENGNTILLDAGSTVYSLALLLHQRERLTVVTHDLNIAHKMAINQHINLICTGGIARENDYILEGAQVIDFIRTLRVDKTFIGVDAIHTDGTISNVNINEVPIKRAMIAAAEQVILLTDSSKFGTTGFAKVCDISDVDIIITDRKIEKNHLDFLKNRNVKFILA